MYVCDWNCIRAQQPSDLKPLSFGPAGCVFTEARTVTELGLQLHSEPAVSEAASILYYTTAPGPTSMGAGCEKQGGFRDAKHSTVVLVVVQGENRIAPGMLTCLITGCAHLGKSSEVQFSRYSLHSPQVKTFYGFIVAPELVPFLLFLSLCPVSILV